MERQMSDFVFKMLLFFVCLMLGLYITALIAGMICAIRACGSYIRIGTQIRRIFADPWNSFQKTQKYYLRMLKSTAQSVFSLHDAGYMTEEDRWLEDNAGYRQSILQSAFGFLQDLGQLSVQVMLWPFFMLPHLFVVVPVQMIADTLRS